MRILFSVSVEMERKVKVYEVKAAFLHGHFSKEIYMELSQECDNKKVEICKLNKSMHGLFRGGRCWNEFSTETILKKRMQQSGENQGLFYKKERENYILYAITVVKVTNSEDFKTRLKLLNRRSHYLGECVKGENTYVQCMYKVIK